MFVAEHVGPPERQAKLASLSQQLDSTYVFWAAAPSGPGTALYGRRDGVQSRSEIH